jgi:hypothetical protein
LQEPDSNFKFWAFRARFVKRYAHPAEESVRAIQDYISKVREGEFPSEEHFYKMKAGELEKMKIMTLLSCPWRR